MHGQAAIQNRCTLPPLGPHDQWCEGGRLWVAPAPMHCTPVSSLTQTPLGLNGAIDTGQMPLGIDSGAASPGGPTH